MIKRFTLIVVAILLGGITAVNAKIVYVPLYIVDTTPDGKVIRHTPPKQLLITQDGHRLILPEMEDSMTFMVFKDEKCEYTEAFRPHQQLTVNLPTRLVGDYEVRLCALDYHYYGYITLELLNESDIPTKIGNLEDITLLGSNTPSEIILDNILGLNVIEYTLGVPYENIKYMSEEDQESFIKYWKEEMSGRRIGLLPEELRKIFPELVAEQGDGGIGINYIELIPVLICCIQELKSQLDIRTEAIVDALARSTASSAIREVRSAIGSTLLTVAPTSVNEPVHVRFLLADDATNAYIAVTDMGGHVMTKVPVSPSETEVSIGSSVLKEGIFLCTLFANGRNVATKRLVKKK